MHTPKRKSQKKGSGTEFFELNIHESLNENCMQQKK